MRHARKTVKLQRRASHRDALLANLVVAALATLAFRAAKVPEGVDRTKPDEYFADAGDPRVHALPEVVH